MQEIEKIETMRVLSYYALTKIHLHNYKSYFIFRLLSGNVNLNPGAYTNRNQHNLNVTPFVNSGFL